MDEEKRELRIKNELVRFIDSHFEPVGHPDLVRARVIDITNELYDLMIYWNQKYK